MKDEIKEILFQLEIVARKHTIELCEDGSKIETMPASVVDELRLNNYSSKLLLDYITNLQDRIDKAIEYIKEHIKHEHDGYNFYSYHLYDFNKDYLLNLLQGKSDE